MTTTPTRKDSNLGELTGRVLDALGLYTEALHDPITVAYGVGNDFSDSFWAHAERKAQAVLAEAGMTADEFLAEVEARTSARWVYFSGLTQLVDA